MEKILVFGTASVANQFLKMIDTKRVEIIGFINSDKSIQSFCGYEVIAPEEITDREYDYIVIASGSVDAITHILLDLGVNVNKIISFIYDEEVIYKNIFNNTKEYLNNTYNRGIMEKWMKDGRKLPVIYPTTLWNDDFLCFSCYKDYVRCQMVYLIERVLTTNNIPGALAELGVFQGDYSVVIDSAFRKRKFYLFDTFKGFAPRDVIEDDSIDNVKGEMEKFKETSVEFVLSRLSGENEIIVKKGYFPDTFDLQNEVFSFVSIDLNLYNPVKRALELFYPRMASGGYIQVSAYLAPFYEGTKKAVDDWCREAGVNFVPVADFYGSIVIIKE